MPEWAARVKPDDAVFLLIYNKSLAGSAKAVFGEAFFLFGSMNILGRISSKGGDDAFRGKRCAEDEEPRVERTA